MEKKMKIDYTSDLHIDFWLEQELNEDILVSSLIHKNLFSKANGEVLLIGGDIGHYNEQNVKFLELLLRIYDYKHIFFVLGNHDYYLINHQWEKYKGNSFARIDELKQMLEPFEHITLLDGDVCAYKGINFGGCGMWYDGVYARRLNYNISDSAMQTLWEDKMMDAIHIGGISHFKELFNLEVEKLHNIYKKSDVILTHVNPSISPKHTKGKYTLNLLNGFYSFDGEYFLENTSARYWLFGHTHVGIDYEVADLKVMCNPLGYPNERVKPTLLSFDI
jgi:UDP-2,3-diacylglucosamine pyrophosphatase LpxH